MRVVLVICLCGAVLGVFLCNVGVLVQVLLISGGVLFSNFFMRDCLHVVCDGLSVYLCSVIFL